MSICHRPLFNGIAGAKGASSGCENGDNASCSSTATASTASPSTSPHINSADGLPTASQRIIEEADEDEESAPYDHMHIARQMVFWWQKPNPVDDEFCQNTAECKVKVILVQYIRGMTQWNSPLHLSGVLMVGLIFVKCHK